MQDQNSGIDPAAAAAARNLCPKVIKLSRCAILTSVETKTFSGCRAPWTLRTSCLLMDLLQTGRKKNKKNRPTLSVENNGATIGAEKFPERLPFDHRPGNTWLKQFFIFWEENKWSWLRWKEGGKWEEGWDGEEGKCELPTAAQRAVWCSDVEINYWCGACSHLITNLIRTLQNVL